MGRIDIPTVECDRCKVVTQVLAEMARYQTIDHSHMSGIEKWMLCPDCWGAFKTFIDGSAGHAE